MVFNLTLNFLYRYNLKNMTKSVKKDCQMFIYFTSFNTNLFYLLLLSNKKSNFFYITSCNLLTVSCKIPSILSLFSFLEKIYFKNFSSNIKKQELNQLPYFVSKHFIFGMDSPKLFFSKKSPFLSSNCLILLFNFSWSIGNQNTNFYLF